MGILQEFEIITKILSEKLPNRIFIYPDVPDTTASLYAARPGSKARDSAPRRPALFSCIVVTTELLRNRRQQNG